MSYLAIVVLELTTVILLTLWPPYIINAIVKTRRQQPFCSAGGNALRTASCTKKLRIAPFPVVAGLPEANEDHTLMDSWFLAAIFQVWLRPIVVSMVAQAGNNNRLAHNGLVLFCQELDGAWTYTNIPPIKTGQCVG